jgi:hypothetical protein
VSEHDEGRVVIPDGPPPGWTHDAWRRRTDHAYLTLARVLLRVRERIIAEGKLPNDDS